MGMLFLVSFHKTYLNPINVPFIYLLYHYIDYFCLKTSKMYFNLKPTHQESLYCVIKHILSISSAIVMVSQDVTYSNVEKQYYLPAHPCK